VIGTYVREKEKRIEERITAVSIIQDLRFFPIFDELDV